MNRDCNPLEDLRGIVTVLNTPFNEDLEVDAAALAAHVDYALNSGVNGFLVPAMAAEVRNLNAGERRLMLQTVLERAAGRVPVVAGVYADDADARLRLVEDYVALGADAVLVSVPFESEDGLVRDVARVAEAGARTIMVQDWSFSGYGIPLPAILRLAAEVPQFRSIKIEVVASGLKYTQILEATDGGLHVAGGWAVGQMMEGLERGVHTFMSTGLHEIYGAIHGRYAEGRVEETRRLFFRLLPILAFSNQHLDVSIHFFKHLLHRQGVYPTPAVREPILPFDRFHMHQADILIEYAIELMREVREGRA